MDHTELSQIDFSKGTFLREKNREISIFVPSPHRSNISLHSAVSFEFPAFFILAFAPKLTVR